MKKAFDVIVIGAGHAGCEAALAAARMGCRSLLVTINLDTIAGMPCNPSIGGPGKGHIVMEIDALGGEMAKNIDETYIHIRMLNTSKGPAVQALRAQADKSAYHIRMKGVLEGQSNLSLRQDFVNEIIVDNGRAKGVELSTGEKFFSEAVIVTTGTFLNGLIHIGEKRFPAGRLGEFPSIGLAESIKRIGLRTGRLKTGTVPRVSRRSINFDKCTEMKPSPEPLFFSSFSSRAEREQISCWQTHTTGETREVVMKNIEKSAMFSGQIKGVGPRYCPSIEDKMNRFEDRDRHPVFIEPEGLKTEEIYLQGISTSLPIEIQDEFLRTIPGLEEAEIMRPAYAIEYDFVDPTQLKPTLETKEIKGLFLAGQINGTSGYEEAAGQGILAGINAAAGCKGLGEFRIGRSEGYIGVLVDDLITEGTTEPYRIFTSRAEFRLLLRQDNASVRLAGKAHEVGLLAEERYLVLEEKTRKIKELVESMKLFHVKHGPNKGKTAYELIKSPKIGVRDVEKFGFNVEGYDGGAIERAEIEVKYEGYIKRQKRQVERRLKSESVRIPGDFDYDMVKGLSNEAREKLRMVSPENIGMASRISGVSPADITVLMYYLERKGKLDDLNGCR